MLSLASSKCVTKFRTVLIILCIIFPPIIPFVLLYYVFGNRGANRRNARATERLVSAEQEANIIRFAGLSPEQRNQVLEAKHQANAQHIRNNLIAVTVVILMVGIFVLHRSPETPPVSPSPIATQSPEPIHATAAEPVQAPITLDSVPATLTSEHSQAYDDGRNARAAFENWFNGLGAGDFHDGAQYWAGHRSVKPVPTTCHFTSPSFEQGCLEAKRQLTPSDIRRKTEPEFKVGWNSL
jgi:hypothetical protein